MINTERDRRWFLRTAAAAAPALAMRPWHHRTYAQAATAAAEAATGGLDVPVAILNTGTFNTTFTLGTTQPDTTNTGYSVLGYTPAALTDIQSGVTPAPAGTSWTTQGDLNITTDGTVIQGYRIHGMVRIAANNCTLQGCHVVSYVNHPYPGTPWYGVVSTGSSGGGGSGTIYTGNTIRYCDIGLWDDWDLTDNSGYAAVGGVTPYWPVGVLLTGGANTVHRCNIHDTNDLVYINAGTGHQIQGNYLHDPMFRNDDGDQNSGSPPNWSHNDGTQIMGGTSHVVDGNSYVMVFSSNTGMPAVANPSPLPAEQAWPNCHGVFLQSYNSNVSGVTVTRNWFKYASAPIRFAPSPTGHDPSGAVTVTSNRFTPDQGREFSQYVQVRMDPTTSWPSVTFDGTNVYSTDPDTPPAAQGLPLNGNPAGNPSTVGTVTIWAWNKNAHTP